MAKEKVVVSVDGLEFTDAHEVWMFSVSKDREVVSINGKEMKRVQALDLFTELLKALGVTLEIRDRGESHAKINF